jgi:phosphatidate cytidylyltransferase
MKRLLTAAVLIPIILYVVLWANFWVFLAVLLTAAVLSYREYDGIAAAYGFGAPGPVGYGAGILLLVSEGQDGLLIAGIALLAMVLAMRSAELPKALPRAALLLLGTIYIFASWKCALPLRSLSPHWLMFALALNWVGDGAAYYIGRAFGRHKMAPRVSPNKSWEGAAASVAASMVVGAAYLPAVVPISFAAAILLAAAANIAGQVGDLAESAMKRGAGVKDSGSLLPGHGGFLDRVDSTLFALPVVYAGIKLLT